MLQKDFVNDFNKAPYDLYEFAVIATDITDNINLKIAADNLIYAQAEFEKRLNEIGLEVG